MLLGRQNFGTSNDGTWLCFAPVAGKIAEQTVTALMEQDLFRTAWPRQWPTPACACAIAYAITICPATRDGITLHHPALACVAGPDKKLKLSLK